MKLNFFRWDHFRHPYVPHINPFDEKKYPKLWHPSMPLKILRNFGWLLRKLDIRFSAFNINICDQIEYYLAEYCSESLNQLSIDANYSRSSSGNLHKPLMGVTHLNIYIMGFKESNIILNIKENLPALKYVHIYGFNNYDRFEKLHFNGIDYFKFETDPISFMMSNMSKYPFSFDTLKHLKFKARVELNDDWFNFVRNLKQHLTTLQIMGVKFDKEHPIDFFAKILETHNFLPKIEELQVELLPYMCPRNILRFLEQSRNLKKLMLNRYKSKYTYLPIIIPEDDLKILKTIVSNLGAEWKYHIIYPFLKKPLTYYIPFECYVIERITDSNIQYSLVKE